MNITKSDNVYAVARRADSGVLCIAEDENIWTAIRECGRLVRERNAKPLQFGIHESMNYLRHVEAFRFLDTRLPDILSNPPLYNPFVPPASR